MTTDATPAIDSALTSAHELARRIAAREISSEEVVSAHLERLDALRGLNALAFPAGERALAEARARDREVARGELRGALHGVPFTVKDWIEAEGLPCAAGRQDWRERVATEDATAVRRLRAAGGILLGKTAVRADSTAYGRVGNPRRAGYSPAGSSSGDAALVASAGSPLGLGSDSGGSIRQPAHACGVFGLKPTSGRVPLTGHLPRINPTADPRTVIGPLARTADDLELALRLIAGEDGRDPSVVPAPLGASTDVHLPSLRVAFYFLDDGPFVPTPETREAVLAAACALEGLGCTVREARPPRIEETLPITRAYWARPESESWDDWVPDGESRLSADEVERHLFQWDRFRRSMLGFMGEHDLVLTPISELPAVPHGQPEGSVAYTAPFSLTGQPAVAVPVASTVDGLPIAVQLAARLWREDVTLAAARALQAAFARSRPARSTG